MLLNISYNEPKVKEKIETLVGKPFTLKERLTMNGVGSSKLLISSASVDWFWVQSWYGKDLGCTKGVGSRELLAWFLHFGTAANMYRMALPHFAMSSSCF